MQPKIPGDVLLSEMEKPQRVNEQTISGSNRRVVGDRNLVSGKNARVEGDNNTVSGSNAKVYGNHNIVCGVNAFARGIGNFVEGTGSTNEEIDASDNAFGSDSEDWRRDAIHVFSGRRKKAIGKRACTNSGTLVGNFGGSGNNISMIGRMVGDVDTEFVLNQKKLCLRDVRGGVSTIDGVTTIGGALRLDRDANTCRYDGKKVDLDFVRIDDIIYSQTRDRITIDHDTLVVRIEEFLRQEKKAKVDRAAEEKKIAIPEGEDEEIPEDSEERGCCVCTINKSNCIILDCKHLCLCISCSRSILLETTGALKKDPKCPNCRKDLAKGMEKVFFS